MSYPLAETEEIVNPLSHHVIDVGKGSYDWLVEHGYVNPNDLQAYGERPAIISPFTGRAEEIGGRAYARTMNELNYPDVYRSRGRDLEALRAREMHYPYEYRSRGLSSLSGDRRLEAEALRAREMQYPYYRSRLSPEVYNWVPETNRWSPERVRSPRPRSTEYRSPRPRSTEYRSRPMSSVPVNYEVPSGRYTPREIAEADMARNPRKYTYY